MDSVPHGEMTPSKKIKILPSPNIRTLRLAISASDQLLSMGVAANKVTSKALDITDAFCKYPVHFSITFDQITVSQAGNLEAEPLTLFRPVTMRDVNNMTIQSIQHLIYEIRTGKCNLDEAEAEFDRIISKPEFYPKWLPPLANAFIAPAVTLMFTTNWRTVAVTFVFALIIDRILVSLAHKSVVSFFRQIAASVFVTLAAAVMAWLATRHVGFFVGMNPTLTVVSGIFLLLSGLAIVGSVQDAIEEYYITANARMMRVLMSTAGIVIGVVGGLYIAKKIGIGITISPNPLGLTALRYQIVGGALAAAAYALSTQSRIRAVVWAGIIGGGGLGILYAARQHGIAVIAATGIAATSVGLIASLFSRNWRTPSSGIIAAGIIPLVPGLGLYTGLMQLVNYPPGNPLFLRGVATVFTVIGTAFAIAAGASLGSMLGRPMYRHVTQNRNIIPFTKFMLAQLHADSKED
jgi:uncharacterized membrane protein YjjP (DUF1212 family)